MDDQRAPKSFYKGFETLLLGMCSSGLDIYVYLNLGQRDSQRFEKRKKEE